MAAPVAFRRRLLRVLGPVQVGAVAVLCGLIWVVAWKGYVGRAVTVMIAEAEEIGFAVTSGTLPLEPDRYRWDEPHHVRTDRRTDPMFVQVFNRQGGLLKASPNIESRFSSFPDTLTGHSTDSGFLPILSIQSIDEALVYFHAEPLLGASRDTVGYVQIARYVPAERDAVASLAVYLIILFGAFSLMLLGLTAWLTGHFVRPIAHITEFAAGLGPEGLAQRVKLRGTYDREAEILAGTLNSLLDRLDRSMADMAGFVSDAAHELRTPLTALRGHVELALRRPRTPEYYLETLTLLDGNLERLANMVAALLLLARLDRGEPMSMERIDLSAFVAEAAGGLEEVASSRSVKVRTHTAGETWITGNPELVFRAISNLVENAIQYGSNRVDVTVGRDDGAAVIEVQDDGPGVSEEVADRAFQKFFRSRDASQHHPDGVGLGLSLVSRIVERHGGTCVMESTPGQGTRVRVRFPT